MTWQEHECKLTQDIVELIDRETDLLVRGVKEANLEGLRKRISTLFLQYIKSPTFNPQVTKLLRVSGHQGVSTVLEFNFYNLVTFFMYIKVSL